MKPTTKIVILIFSTLIVMADVNAQTPQEQLSQLVAQLQKSPGDNALREKIIKLAVTMKPSPDIPEDARRPFVKGNTAIKNASAPDDYANAIKLYQEALLLAPWWADAYFNVAKGQELHQDYDAAIQSVKFFLMTSPPATDARDAQDHIYALEELRDKKLATDKAKAEVEKAAKAKNDLSNLTGTWIPINPKSDPRDYQTLRTGLHYPSDTVFYRYRFEMRGENKAVLYMDAFLGKYTYTGEGFFDYIYTGTLTPDGWKWRFRFADGRCGQNQIFRDVPLEILENGNIIRTRTGGGMSADDPMIGFERTNGTTFSPGPISSCVVTENPIMLVRIVN